MVLLPPEIQFDRPSRKLVLTNPMVWLLILLAGIHLIAFIPAHFAQKDYLAKDQEFKELWNSGGSMSLAAQGIEPTRKEEQVRREAYMRTFVERNLFYNIWMVPHWTSGLSILTAWVFQPGWFSLLLAVSILLYFGLWIRPRWAGPVPTFLVIAYSMAGTALYFVLMGMVMDRNAELPFCGISMAAAAALGLLLRSHPSKIPLRYYWVEWKTLLVHPYALAGAWVGLDFIAQVMVNPRNYGWVFALDLASIGIGVALGTRIPAAPSQTRQSFRPANLDVLAPIRNHLNEGWRLAELLEQEAALTEIDRGLKMLLRNSSPDTDLVQQSFQRILSAKNPLPISPQQWYEWGVRLSETNFPSLAITSLENAAKTPGATTDLARPALLQAAELRIRHNIQPQECIPWLQRVIKSRSDDLIGRKANQYLESLTP